MTTTLRKTHSHKKAQAISSGFLKLITFELTPRQGLAKFRSVAKHHTEDNSITVCGIAFFRADKSKSAWFLQCKRMGGM